MFQDKDVSYLRQLNNQYTMEQSMMSELEKFKGLEIYKQERSRVLPNIEARARKALEARVTEVKNAEKALANERKKAAQRTTESPRLMNALALARADFEAAETPEDLVSRIEMVQASGDEVSKLAYGKVYKGSTRKFADIDHRLIANRAAGLANEMEYEVENPPALMDAEMRLQESTTAAIQMRDDVRSVAKELGMTMLDIYAEDAVNVKSGRIVSVNLRTAETTPATIPLPDQRQMGNRLDQPLRSKA